ncbi:1-acyl-sn-glycerol-3-phosphate acyltransferase [Sphingobacterium lactis]|uniref:1-acyl-sn-glycerol-3-phosphate acyltransferase n=1 Tax=Sphingobacterium lactis TaxID=797291 RepID=UPI003EC881E5
MFYPVLKFVVKFGLRWYVSEWRLQNLQQANANVPALIIANHPNSFFDALVIAVHQESEIRFLTRGDIFEKPLANWTLRTFFMLPIYKKSDDEESEIKNAFVYDECVSHLKQGTKILIFPEGVSRNHLGINTFMPQGTNALIQRAVKMDIPIQVQPYLLRYSSFDNIPKAVSLQALEPIDSTDFLQDGQVMSTDVLFKAKRAMENELIKEPLEPNPDLRKEKEWMRLPAKLGYYTHNWLYQLVKKKVREKTDGTIFFDSLLFGVLLFGYPLLIFILSLILGNIFGFWWGMLFFVLLPFLSYCWVQYEPIRVMSDELEDRTNRLNG